MLIVKLEPETNGARANQNLSDTLDILPEGWTAVPEGWTAVPEGLEAAALAALPWLSLTAEEGAVTAVAENAQAKRAFEEAREKEAADGLQK